MAKHKRHHSSMMKKVHAAEHEDRLMRAYDREHERAEHRMHKVRGGHYEGMDPRRRQEMEDAGMIHEDHRAIANMPQNVIMREYASERDYIPEELDDTIRGIEHQKDLDYSHMMRHFKPKKV